MAELWDILDMNRNKTGRLHERGIPMCAGDCHLIVQVWIMNSKGAFLISRQVSAAVNSKWMTTGGCAITGDDGLSAALRETKEELGIDLSQKNGQLFKQYSEPHINDDGTALFDIWIFRQEVDISTVVFQPDETCGAMWASKEKIRQMIGDGVFLSEWYPYLDELFCMCEIPGFDSFVKIEPINKGWSDDKKYYIETADGRRILLRVSDMTELDRKKAEYGMMERVYALGVHTSEPLGFDLCNDDKSCYSLSGWLDGEDAEKALPLMSETEQYVLGLKAGETLRKIHTLSAPFGIDEWQERYSAIIDERIEAYRREGTPFEGNDIILDYLQKNQNLLYGRPQCLLHGDYHEGNLVVGSGDELYIIDLLDEGFGNYGDPWYDFKTFGENENAYFSTGFVRGYFNGEPPQAFWNVLTYYIVTAALTSIVWMKYHKSEELPETINWNEKNAQALSENRSPLMKWYLSDFYIQWTDGVPYKLEVPFDFSFLRKYGKVFKAFDERGSGNISFGIENGDKKYFIKFAGAPKPNYISNCDSGAIDTASAINLLKAAVPLYTELAHPTLIKFVFAEEIGGGYAAVFEWEDAIGIEPKDSPDYMRFMQMPVEKKMKAFEDIVEFHAHVATKGYVALDFYDGSILYDYDKEKVIICDIDLYQKSPFINVDRLGIVGSARYVSPEECVKDAIMDEITNVYTMGATAFALFAYGDRSPAAWTLSPELYAVVKKAVSDDRGERQQSIVQLIEEWRAAKV